MSAEHTELRSQHEAVAAQELLRDNLFELLASRAIDAERVLATGRWVNVRLDYFFDDDSCTATPPELLQFVGSVYPERRVGVKAIEVHLARKEGQALKSFIGLTVSNPEPWLVELGRDDDATGMIIPSRRMVLADYMHLATSELPLRYALSQFSLYEWLQYRDAMSVESTEGLLRPEIVFAIAALLPDRPEGIYLRRMGKGREVVDISDPDLQLPSPRKEIIVT